MKVLDIIIGVCVVYMLSEFCLLYEFLHSCTAWFYLFLCCVGILYFGTFVPKDF